MYWECLINSDLREVSQVPLTRLSPLIRGARGVRDLGGWGFRGSDGDLGGWGFRGLVVYWERLINSKIYYNYPMN